MPKRMDKAALLARAQAQQQHVFNYKHDIAVAQRLIDTFATAEPVVFDEDAWWQYEGNVWKELQREDLSTRLHQWQMNEQMRIKAEENKTKFYKLAPGAFQRIINHTRDASARPSFFENAPDGIMLGAQFLRARDSRIDVEKAHPSHRARSSLNVPYDATWRLPEDSLLSHYLTTTFDDPATLLRLGEIAGAALLGLGTRFGKAWFLVDGPDIDGDGGTGKSQFLNLLKGMVPRDRFCSVVPQHFSDDYHGAELHRKTLNVVFETPDSDILREDGVKAIVHGDTITRRRIRQAPLTFAPRALHVFASNSLPEAPGATGAFWDRWEVVEFNKRFRDTDQAIPHLAEKILSRELKHLVHWAIEGARRAISQKGYSKSAVGADALRRWRISAEPIAQFVRDWCEVVTKDDEWTTSAKLYDAYREWCEGNGRSPGSSTKFGRRLRRLKNVEKKRNSSSWYNLRVVEKFARSNPWD